MYFFKKYGWQINLVGTIFFLSRFLMAGYQWWHLFGALIFFASFLQSFFEKKKELTNDEEE
tara:strand:+ start:1122 stop:1304 length:183 start_codon:yes stop_codon:yes gene_type:complete